MKGFTLIELLAVIVILAIILLIAMPLIGDVIESTKIKAYESSVKMIVEAAKMEYSVASLNGSSAAVDFLFEDSVQTSTVSGRLLEFNGEIPENGKVSVSNSGTITYALHNGTYCAFYDNATKKTVVEKIDSAACEAKLTTVFTCGDNFVDSRDGKSYSTIQMGTQCWFKENLAYSTPACLAATWDATGANDSCQSYEYNSRTEVIYQWDAAMNGETIPGSQGQCPTGWHIPTDDEFKQLEIFVGMSPTDANLTGSRGTNEGETLKSASGLNIYLAGWVDSEGNLSSLGRSGSYWTSTTVATKYFEREFGDSQTNISRYDEDGAYGMSIRCVK